MTVRPRSLVLACALLLVAVAPAMAQEPVGDKKKALELYDRAKVQYDLGHWKQAIDLWVQAYETFNAPEFLFNIGQAYRQDGNCDRALFFYRRYLASKPNAKLRGEVEGFIKEMEGKCKAAPEPTGPDEPDPTGPQPEKTPAGQHVDGGVDAGDTGDTAADGGEDLEEDAEIEGGVEPTGDQPRYFAIRVSGGPSFPSLGDLEVGTLASFALGGGHAFHFGKLAIEPGVLATYTPIPWESVPEVGMTASGTASMTGILGNIGASYAFMPKLAGRAEVGAGAVIFGGLGEPGNPFLEEGTELTGGKAIALFNARLALGAEYAVTRNFIVHAMPVVLSYSPSSPLRNDIDQVTQFQILVGAGYQM